MTSAIELRPHTAPDREQVHAHVREQIRAAIADDTTVRISGRGSWLFGGPPLSGDRPLTLASHRGVVEYVPGDLVITVLAGTTLGELRSITASAGQMLAIAPYGHDDDTIGATVATATSAPLALDELSIRDLVLGLTVISGTGEIIAAGGKVVKNVAGFDLVRLQTGAFGTLGVITDVSLRLHAQPMVDVTYAGTPTDPLSHWLPSLTQSFAPLPTVVCLAPQQAPVVYVRVTGNAARAAALHRTAATLLGDTPLHQLEAAAISTLRHVPTQRVVLRVRTAPSHGVSLLTHLQQHLPTATMLYAPLRGSARVMTDVAMHDPAANAAAITNTLATCVAEWPVTHPPLSIVIEQSPLPLPRPVSPTATLEASIKRAFDPQHRLNPRADLPI